jgi:hypothetical protein
MGRMIAVRLQGRDEQRHQGQRHHAQAEEAALGEAQQDHRHHGEQVKQGIGDHSGKVAKGRTMGSRARGLRSNPSAPPRASVLPHGRVV